MRGQSYVLPGLRRPAEVFANWLDDISYMCRTCTDGVWVLTFHPQVIGRGHRMLGLEAFLDRLADYDVTYARVADVAEGWRSGRHRS